MSDAKSITGSYVGSAEYMLDKVPSFNLVVVASSSSTASLASVLVENVFGVKNIKLNALKPIRLPSNERLTLHYARSSSTAREYLQSRGTYTPAEMIHAVWYLVDEVDSKGIKKEELALGVEPIIIVVSKNQINEQRFQQQSIDLRMSGIQNTVIAVNTSNQASLVDLSKRTESTLIGNPDLRLVWVAAQRVSSDEKIATSISKGMKLFVVAVGASAQPLPFVGGATGVGVMTLLQRDIVKIYNFDDPSNVLLSKSLGNIFYEVATGLPVKWITSLVGLSTISGLWEAPSSARNITQAIADLVLVLDAILFTIQHKSPLANGNANSAAITSDEVKAIIQLYEKGPSRKSKLKGAEEFRRDAVHEKLGTKRVGRFDVWKSLKRKEAEQALKETIEVHRYRGQD